MRPYKCVDELLSAFAALPDLTARLIVAGGCGDAALEAELHRLAARDARVRLDLRHVPDNEVPVLMGAADVVCCPSRGVLTSGSVLLAMSYGRPVIAPSVGCIPETVGDAGWLYCEDQCVGLNKIIQFVADQNDDEVHRRGREGYRLAQNASPRNVAERLISAYGLGVTT